MGVRDRMGDLAKIVHEALTGREEKLRRQAMQRRINLYRDDYQAILWQQITLLYTAAEIRDRLWSLLQVAGCNSYLKRIVNDIARPVYAHPPVRKVSGTERDQTAYAALAAEMRLNRRMALASRLMLAVNWVGLVPRVIQVGKPRMRLDVLTPNMVTVIPDPAFPLEALAIAYPTQAWDRSKGKWVKAYAAWDDTEFVTLDASLGIPLTPYEPNPYGRIPLVEIHRDERWDTYWDTTGGNDLEAAQLALAWLMQLTLKLHRAQGERVLAVTGDLTHLIEDQTLDGETVLQFPAGATGGQAPSVQVLELRADADHYRSTMDWIETTVAANYGLSRERLNQKSAGTGDEEGLKERTAEVMQTMTDAEAQLFELIKPVSLEHPEHRLSEGAKVSVDFGPIHQRVDRKTQLEIRKTERSMGVRSILDDIFEDNPDIRTVPEALEEMKDNMRREAEYVLLRRALGITDDVTVEEPGQNQDRNGAMGPAVRDGKMTRDEAADLARRGPMPLATADIAATARRLLTEARRAA